MQKIYYYSEEDDFEGKDIEPIKIDENYVYVSKNPFWNFLSFVLYRLLAEPLAYLYMKWKFDLKIINKACLKEAKKSGYFIYANHTQAIGDALLPSLVNFPRRVFVVVHPNNISIPFWGNIIRFLGPLPVPGDVASSKNFIKAISDRMKQRGVVTIYPEAHVWNYYTKIRNFKADSFKYPVKEGVPAYSLTVTYRKRKKDIPRMEVYVDGPFYAKDGLSYKEKQQDLRNQIYDAMCERAKNSDVEYIEYSKVVENS